MSEPILRAVTESGTIWDDPSEDLLFELLSELERGDELFFVVERLGVAEVYMQVLLQDDRQYLVEYRAGGPTSHFAATCGNKRLVHEALTKWAFGIAGRQDLLAWAPVTI